MNPMTSLVEQMEGLAQLVQDLALRVQQQENYQGIPQGESPPASLSPSVEPPIQLPDRFSGDRRAFRTFKEGCRLYFRLRPRTSGNEEQRVGILMSLLQGSPQEWAFSLPPDSPELSSVDRFFNSLGLLFDDPDREAVAETQLTTLRQGKRTVEEYASEFRRWCVPSGWNDPALRCQFRVGLADHVRDMLVAYPAPSTLDDAIALAVRLDRRFRERRREQNPPPLPHLTPLPRSATSPEAESTGVPPEEPMQVGASSVDAASDRRTSRRTLGLCFYCGGEDHRIRECPKKEVRAGRLQGLDDPREGHLGEQVLPMGSKRLLLPVKISYFSICESGNAFVDSGSASNFVDAAFAKRLGLPWRPLAQPMRVVAIDSTPLAKGKIQYCTPELEVRVGSRHKERCVLYIMEGLPADVVLGLPWLQKHNPVIDWDSGELIGWGKQCFGECHFSEVVSKTQSKRVSPHRSYECASHSPRENPVPIFPKETIVSAIFPDLTTEIKTHQDMRPANCPASRVFVPTQFRLPLLKELHDSVLSGHPGVSGTKRLISRNYWWPSWCRDVKAYVAACDGCARARVPGTRPPGELCPLPRPKYPWTHLPNAIESPYVVQGVAHPDGLKPGKGPVAPPKRGGTVMAHVSAGEQPGTPGVNPSAQSTHPGIDSSAADLSRGCVALANRRARRPHQSAAGAGSGILT